MPVPSQVQTRRGFLTIAAGAAAIGSLRPSGSLSGEEKPPASPLANAIFLGDKFVDWQASYGGPQE